MDDTRLSLDLSNESSSHARSRHRPSFVLATFRFRKCHLFLLLPCTKQWIFTSCYRQTKRTTKMSISTEYHLTFVSNTLLVVSRCSIPSTAKFLNVKHLHYENAQCLTMATSAPATGTTPEDAQNRAPAFPGDPTTYAPKAPSKAAAAPTRARQANAQIIRTMRPGSPAQQPRQQRQSARTPRL